MRKLYYNVGPDIEGSVVLEPSSKNTSEVWRFDLRKPTDTSRFSLKGKVIDTGDGPLDYECRILYEKKRKGDAFPSEKNAKPDQKGDLKVGDYLELILAPEEARALYKGLAAIYNLVEDNPSLPRGAVRYVPLDRASQAVLERIQGDPSLRDAFEDENSVSIFKELFKALNKSSSRERLLGILSTLESDDIQSFEANLNLEMIKRAARLIEDHMEDSREEFWQKQVLEQYPWIISQILTAPCMVFGTKAYVGGKDLGNHGGNLADFIYKNKLTNNVTIVEIKTPKAPLLRKNYRNNSYSLSDDLGGGIIQSLSYRQSLMENFAQLRLQYGEPFEASTPACILIIGNTDELHNPSGELDRVKLASFENLRGHLNGITVVTFDELLEKLKGLIAIMSSGDLQYPSDATQCFEDDIPF